jgi:hypothetical protein
VSKRRGTETLFLEPITSEPRRTPFLVYDVESKDEDTQRPGFTRPFLVGAYDGKTCQMFVNHDRAERLPWRRRHLAQGGCIDRFMRWLLQKKHQGHRVYAHNGGNFDHLHILPWLRAHRDEFDFEIVPVQSTIQMIRVWWKGMKEKAQAGKRRVRDLSITLLDSMRLLPMSLQKAAKAMGLKGKKEMDLSAPESDPKWRLYLRYDCEQLYETMKRVHVLVEEKLGGEVGITAPSTSMKIFRRSFLKGKIPIHKKWPVPEVKMKPELEPPGQAYEPRPPTFHDWTRKAFFGGRTEILRMRGEHLRYFDINSSYVACMKEDMPAGNRIVIEPDPKTGQAKLDWRLLRSHIGFIECTVRIPETCRIPPLPYRHRETGKLVFPAGEFRGVWDADELQLLFEPEVNGEIVHVRRVAWIGRKRPFTDFMDQMWGLRDKTKPNFDEGLSALGKLFGNGSFGKYGQSEERKRIVLEQEGGRKEFICIVCGERTRNKEDALCSACEGDAKPANGRLESGVWLRTDRVEAPYIIPHIAAHVTSLARIKLWHYMVQADDGGRNILCSCDTDSVFTDADMPSSKKLGELKDEYPGKTFRGTFVQPKVYMLETEDGSPIPGEHLKTCPAEEARKRGVPEEERPKCSGCSDYKVAMKGFPKEVRTRENLHLLEAGMRRFSDLEDKLDRGEISVRAYKASKEMAANQYSVQFSRLQKIRSMASGIDPYEGKVPGFSAPPAMVSILKGFRSAYDKRTVLADGSTKPIVLSLSLNEPAMAVA